MGYKGLSSLKAIVNAYGADGIEAIISARDKNIKNRLVVY